MNQSCIVSHQCSDFPDSACLEGRCKCMDKYRAENVHDCVTSKQDLHIFVMAFYIQLVHVLHFIICVNIVKKTKPKV